MLAGSIMNKGWRKNISRMYENTMSKLYGTLFKYGKLGKNVESSIKTILNDVDNNQRIFHLNSRKYKII